MQILVAVPHETFMGIVKSYLTDRGHAAQFASNDVECVEILRKHQTEMLILANDLDGGSDGVLAEMNQDEDLSDLPVVLVGQTPNSPSPNIPKIMLGPISRQFRLSELDCKIEVARVLWRMNGYSKSVSAV